MRACLLGMSQYHSGDCCIVNLCRVLKTMDVECLECLNVSTTYAGHLDV